MDITSLHHIHFTGIKGVGMTALALCAQDLGMRITGSDTDEEFVTDETLKLRGINWEIGFTREHFNYRPDLVIATGAHGGVENPEAIAAKDLGIPVLTHAQALGEFMHGKIGISVCGVGGKTTTSAMIAHILDRLGEKPSFAVGTANIFSLGAPGRYEKEGKYFVAEADEYVNSPTDNTPRFNFQNPDLIIATNIKHDHPDVYPTLDDTKKTFLQFFGKLINNGTLVANFDDEVTGDLLNQYQGKKQTYGKDAGADWIITDVVLGEGKTVYSLLHEGKKISSITLSVPGLFNIYNATASLLAVSLLGLDVEKAATSLSTFTGTRRRFEKMEEQGGILYYDDYAHHPTEIQATLKAAREWFPKRRIIAIFQPHTYSRTQKFLSQFAQSFNDADIVGIMDIYASSREHDTLEISGELLASEVQKNHPDAHYVGSHQKTLEWIHSVGKSSDFVITMGAGDIFKLYKQL